MEKLIEKECIHCKEVKSVELFDIRKDRPSGYSSYCSECRRVWSREYRKRNADQIRARDKAYKEKNKEKFRAKSKRYAATRRHVIKDYQLKRAYGISLVDFNLLLEQQDYKCAICEVSQVDLNKALAVDHCHETYVVRGLLCTGCNRGIGYFSDNTDSLEKAIKYLTKNRAKKVDKD